MDPAAGAGGVPGERRGSGGSEAAPGSAKASDQSTFPALPTRLAVDDPVDARSRRQVLEAPLIGGLDLGGGEGNGIEAPTMRLGVAGKLLPAQRADRRIGREEIGDQEQPGAGWCRGRAVKRKGSGVSGHAKSGVAADSAVAGETAAALTGTQR